jgi:uncharacterized membrane protein YkvA (DUF1232 family)
MAKVISPATLARGAAVADHLRRVNPKAFKQFIGRVQLALECVRDVVRRRYRLPWKTVAALTAALAYFLSPIDVVPDLIPLSGFVDDAAVLGLVFGAAEIDLRRYCTWRGLDAAHYFNG